jgi:hypothetical protein
VSPNKDFALTERYSLQLRAEAFNITNEINFGDLNPSLGGNFGVVNSALPARELQVAGKIVFQASERVNSRRWNLFGPTLLPKRRPKEWGTGGFFVKQ